jgi:AsmA protein
MKRFVKWAVLILCIIVLVIIIGLILAPNFIDIDKYKPVIEKKVAKAIGRPFSINGSLKLRLFPVTKVSFSDLHIGNPEGFKEKDFVSLKSFDVQIKLLPLLFSKDLQVKRFVMKEPKVVLIKAKNGKVNWQFKPSTSSPKRIELKEKDVELKKGSSLSSELPLKKLSVDEFAITNAAILWIDQVTGKKTGITGINLRLKNISFTKPIGFELTAKIEGNPVKIDGQIGPIGKTPGKGIMPICLNLNAFKELNLNVKGKVKDLSSKNPSYELALNLKPFSLRRLMSKVGEVPFKFSDPKVLQKISLSAYITGTARQVSIKKGILVLDQSKMNFFLNAKEFEKPNIAFEINLDSINVDRYIPVAYKTKKPKKVVTAGKKAPAPRLGKKSPSIDYTPLRKLEMDGKIKIKKLIVKKVALQNIYVKLTAKNGLLQIKPMSMDICRGKMLLNAMVNVKNKTPVTRLALSISHLLIGQLIKDMLKKDLLTGTFDMKLSLNMKGDTPEQIISTLNGSGDLLIKDGSIIGLDLSGMIQNIKAAFGLAQARKLKRKTIFSVIKSKFVIKNGVLRTKETQLISPHLKVSSIGKANLKNKTLNFRINPEYIKNPERSITVPVIVSGTFSSPRFAPDLKGIAKEMIFKKLFKKKAEKEEKENPIEEMGKELLRGIFGR